MKFAKLFLCGIASLNLAAAAAQAGVEIIPTHGRNLDRLAVAHTGENPANALIVGSTYDNRVCAFSQDGTHRWDVAVGGFVFDLAVGDLNGDGRDEIVAAGADGLVYSFDAAGQRLWTADMQAPVYQVAVAKLDGKTPMVLAGGVSREVVAFAADGQKLHRVGVNGAVRVMRAGDFDGDGADEVAVLPIRGQAQDVVFLKGPKLTKLKEVISSSVIPWDPVTRRSTDTGTNFRKGKQPWTGRSLKSANGVAADLDGDGAAEFIYSSGAYALKGGLRPLVSFPEKFKVTTYDYHYNMRLLAVGRLIAGPGAEVVIVEGPQVRLYDAAGKELGQAVAPQGFTDAVYLPGSPRGSVLLGSSPNGDDNFYRLTFEPGWEEALELIERRGFMAGVGSTLEKIVAAAARWNGQPMIGADGPFDVVVNHAIWSGWDTKKFDIWIAEVRDYEKQFSYPRLRFATAFWPGENAPLLRPDGKPWGRDKRLAHDLTREQIVAGAKYFETARCHFWVQVGHGCDPHLEVATVAAMLEAAPTMLLGFISAEDEQLEDVPYYFEHHIKPILELCLKHRKRFILRDKDVWWAQWPANAKMRELIFNGRYRSVLLPSVEDSNSRCPEINLASRVGLWLDGQVDDWASRCSADWFCANRAWEWEYPMTGHPHLRYYVSQALLGARLFMLLNGERERSTNRWTRVGTEGTATFLHLLGRGVVTPPRREQLKSISPVALAMRQPSERFANHGANGHHEEKWADDGTDSRPWAFDRLDTYWAMAPLPPTDVSTYLWGRTRRDAAHLPVTTPHGFVALVPGGGNLLRDGGSWTTMWTTDGDTLGKHDKAYSLAEARTAILADLAAGEKGLPFHVEGHVFDQVIEQAPGYYIIALEDPGWLDPAERTVKLTTRLSGIWKLTDRLSGAAVGTLAAPLELTVPAGALRLLDLRRD